MADNNINKNINININKNITEHIIEFNPSFKNNNKNIKDIENIENYWEKQQNITALPPLSLYIHMPWCVQKCPYCDFNSHEQNKTSETNTTYQLKDEDIYIDALIFDLSQSLASVWGRPIHSVFIGGGTPSLFSGKSIQRLLDAVRQLLPMQYCQEITMEANPSSVEAEKFQAFADAGVTRLSLGIQTFNNDLLQKIGRVHDEQQAIQAIEIAQRYFSRINLDLMYALPMQSFENLASDIEKALSFGTEHLSCYQLTLEPNTLFAKYPPKLPDDDTAYQMQDYIFETLAKNGFHRYEISAFSKNIKNIKNIKNSENIENTEKYQRTQRTQSLHNLNYWHFGDYLGIGAGAHGKITNHQGVYRTVKYKQPKQYLEAFLKHATLNHQNHQDLQNLQANENFLHPLAIENKKIPAKDLLFEFMLNTLRLTDGFKLSLFQQYTGLPWHLAEEYVQKAIDKKLILPIENNIIQPSQLGLDFLSELQGIFLI